MWLGVILALCALGVLAPEPSASFAATLVTLRTEGVPVGWGQVQSTGLTLSASVGALDTTIPVTDGNPATTNDYRFLKVGMILKIDTEQLLITGLTDNIPDPLGVSEAPPYSDTATVLRARGGTVAAAHSLGAVIKGSYVRVPIDVSGVAYRDGGTLSASITSATTQNSGA